MLWVDMNNLPPDLQASTLTTHPLHSLKYTFVYIDLLELTLLVKLWTMLSIFIVKLI